jgi:SNF2 family DNA or RNA helicase
MLIVKKIDNSEFLAEVKMPHFNITLSVVKKIPVRRYCRIRKAWLFPVSLLPVVKRMSRMRGIKCIIEKDAEMVFYNHVKFRLRQKKVAISENIKTQEMQNLKLPLRKYQVIGAEHLYRAIMENGGGALFDPVGIGKTAQSLSASERLLKEKKIRYVIVIAKSSAKYNWEEEVLKFTGKECLVISGNKREREKLYNTIKCEYIVINYDLLMRDEKYLNGIIKHNEVLIIFDEIQCIKNTKTKRSSIAFKLKNTSKFSIGLTASPIENTILDLFGIFHGIIPSLFGTYISHFKESFTVLDFFGAVIGAKNKKLLKSLMRPFILRRIKSKIEKELPNITIIDSYIELSDTHRVFYESEKKIVEAEIDATEDEGILRAKGLKILQRLLKAVLYPENETGKKIENTKLSELQDIVAGTGKKDKIIIFCSYIAPATEIKNALEKKYKILHAIGHKTSAKERHKIVKKFNSDDSIKILVTTNILKDSVNIESANHVINYDIPYNPETVVQRIGRMDRMTQKNKNLFVINLIAVNTVEEKIYKKIIKPKISLREEMIDNNIKDERVSYMSIIKGEKNEM